MKGKQREGFRRRLLRWYDEHKREMPWRGAEDAYAVWVSEVMLQQTRVATVVEYYERWMERFPTVFALAQAPVEEVLELWSGLGYYRRARHLHQAAKVVVEEGSGRLPESVKGLRQLPGIGPYTAGAIASIAFGKREPLVDGNVRRVLARLYALSEEMTEREREKYIWARAGEITDPNRPGDFNQALMELGSEVCRARSPRCEICPVEGYCEALTTGDPERFSRRKQGAKPRPMRGRSCVVFREHGGEREFLLRRRPEEGLLGGLWEVPSVEEAGRRWPRMEELSAICGGQISREEVGEVEHIFSHRRLRVRVHVKRWAGESIDGDGAEIRWVKEGEIEGVAASALEKKLLEVFQRWRRVAGRGVSEEGAPEEDRRV